MRLARLKEIYDGNAAHAGREWLCLSRNLNPNLVRIETLKPLGRETRKHPPAQIRKLQASIEQFGFVLPIVIDATSRVIAGWGLAVAAKKLGLPEVPAVTITDLDEAKLRMLRLALNRLSEDSRWDLEALRLEFSDIMEIGGEIDLRISGFEMGEIDVAFEASGSDEEDDLPALNETATPVTKPGDLWLLGEHRLLCANALMSESYARLLGDERAQMIFTDPPWNIPIAGHVSGLGSTQHGDFAMGCGEMSAAEFEAFLRTTRPLFRARDFQTGVTPAWWAQSKSILTQRCSRTDPSGSLSNPATKALRLSVPSFRGRAPRGRRRILAAERDGKQARFPIFRARRLAARTRRLRGL